MQSKLIMVMLNLIPQTVEETVLVRRLMLLFRQQTRGRLETLQVIQNVLKSLNRCNSFEGVDKSFAIQAGRERNQSYG